MKVPIISLVIALACCCGAGAQSQQAPVTTPTASTESTHPDTDFLPQARTVPERLPATGFVMPDVLERGNTYTSRSSGNTISGAGTRRSVVKGGVMDKSALGINWWATRRWKIGFDYGLTGLDRAGAHGVTDSFHTRLQRTY